MLPTALPDAGDPARTPGAGRFRFRFRSRPLAPALEPPCDLQVKLVLEKRLAAPLQIVCGKAKLEEHRVALPLLALMDGHEPPVVDDGCTYGQRARCRPHLRTSVAWLTPPPAGSCTCAWQTQHRWRWWPSRCTGSPPQARRSSPAPAPWRTCWWRLTRTPWWTSSWRSTASLAWCRACTWTGAAGVAFLLRTLTRCTGQEL